MFRSTSPSVKEWLHRPRRPHLGQTNVLNRLATAGRYAAASDHIRGRQDVTRIAVVGAFDRFNYGDLLFPIIVEKVLQYYGCQVQADFYGLFKRDLRNVGGRKTRPMSALFRPPVISRTKAVLIAGGDLVGTTFTDMVDAVVPAWLGYVLQRLDGRWGRAFSETLCRLFLRVQLEFPWIVSPDDFPQKTAVAYNCVGGMALPYLPCESQQRICSRLRTASFLSVRDTDIQRRLGKEAPDLPVRLAPDSAVLLSFFHSQEALSKVISPVTSALLRKVGEHYLCFQVNKRTGAHRAALLARQLEAVYEHYGLRTLLLPLGRARHHEDHRALAAIHRLLRTPSALVRANVTVYDIASMIARASAFCGTSLHGNITALSYCVPYLALTQAVAKVPAFMEAWGLPAHHGCAPPQELRDRLGVVLRTAKTDLQRKRDELVHKSLRNFNAMFKALGILSGTS